jgi:hypothetical protein
VNRLLIRFLLVLGAGVAVLLLATTAEKTGEKKESPTVITGPLGDMGTRIGTGERGGPPVQINPIRDFVVTLLEKVDNPADHGSTFQPIAELRGRKAEFKTPELQMIHDALAVYEIRGDPEVPGDERRRVFDAVMRYRPMSDEEALRARKERDAKDRDELQNLKVTHIRVRAAEGVLDNREGTQRIHFYGGPPEGVEVTVFGAEAQAILEVRADRFTCTYLPEDGRGRIVITTDKLVRVYTPDRLYSLQGVGLQASLSVGRIAPTGTSDVLRLMRQIRFTSVEGYRRRPIDPGKTSKARLVEERITVTGDGPAVLRLRRMRAENRPNAIFVDMLELANRVHVNDRSKYENRERDVVDHLNLDLDSNYLRLWIRERRFEAAEAREDVVLRSALRRISGGEEKALTTEIRGARARLSYVGETPRAVRVFAWSFRPTPIGLRFGGPLHMAFPYHRPPEVEGSFTDPSTDNARFKACCEGDILLESIGGDLATRRGRLTLNKNVEINLQGPQESPARKREAAEKEAAEKEAAEKETASPEWMPGSSLINVRDRFVITHHGEPDRGEPDRVADFRAIGRVRVETLIGKLEAEEVQGVIRSGDAWRVVATGFPRLIHPITSRTEPALARSLRTFNLTPPVEGARPSESGGHLSIEGRRASLDFTRTRTKDRGETLSGRIRFREAVKVKQTEALTDPIQLFCSDFLFELEQTNEKDATRAGPTRLRAEGDVVVEAGKALWATGDLLRIDPLQNTASGRRTARAELTGLPARITAVDRTGNKGLLEGKTLLFDGPSRSATAIEGVFARFYPAVGDFMVPGGANKRTVHVHAVELEAGRATLTWNRARSISAFRAVDAVRLRGFDPTGTRSGKESTRSGRLIQWAESDELRYEVVPRGENGRAPVRRLSFLGEVDNPVRIAVRDPRHLQEDDFFLVVPVITLSGPAGTPRLTSITGFGPGRMFFTSQEDLFSSSARSGSDKEKSVRVRFNDGFELRQIEEELYRVTFLNGTEAASRDRDGKLEAWMTASKELSLLLNSAAREGDDDFRAVERGYARGDVEFKYAGDTRGGCDKAYWERGTNELTIVGAPAWVERIGQPRQTFKKATYNRATQRFSAYSGSGQFKTRFNRKKKAGPAKP